MNSLYDRVPKNIKFVHFLY